MLRRVSVSERMAAFARSHSTMDPAEFGEAFAREGWVDRAIAAHPVFSEALGGIDSEAVVYRPVLEQAASAVRDAAGLLVEEEIEVLAEEVCGHLVSAGLVGVQDWERLAVAHDLALEVCCGRCALCLGCRSSGSRTRSLRRWIGVKRSRLRRARLRARAWSLSLRGEAVCASPSRCAVVGSPFV